MPRGRRYTLFATIVGALAVALLVMLGTVQFASDALDSKAAAPGALPSRIPAAFGLSVYRALDRVAAAPYVEVELAVAALSHGDAAAAERYATRLPASPVKDELLARVAAARGEQTLAREYFLAAPDPAAVAASAEQLATNDPAAGYALEGLLRVRLMRTGTHPDAVAQAEWAMGRFANRQAWREVSGSARQREWLRRGLRDFEAAVRLAPLSARYLIADANQADLLGERDRARELFAQAAQADPSSADAIAGLGVIAWKTGDRDVAAAYLTRARRLDAQSLMVRALERDLR
ncbi:MAG: hypothetical protein JO104_05050 [Candidatus Eremiobacteraeota bacterium]|nr:hypothetical protein [Candidatus Eremiobacteraeota bacterium]